jgi:hypothetical protein
MTTYPTPNPYYPPLAPTAPFRPTSVTAMAIIGIIFGGLGVLCKPAVLAFSFVPQPANSPAVAMQHQMMTWNVINTVVGTAISALLLAAAIGSLSLKPWARKGMLAYAAAAVVMNVAGLVVSLIWVVPMMQEVQQQMIQQQAGRGGPPPPQMAAIMQAAGKVGAVLGFVFTMIFPVLLGYFYTRPHVVAAFGGQGGGPPGPYGGGYSAPYGGIYPGAPAQQGYYAPPPAPPPGSYPPPQG